jgi:hypothetical protein
MSHARDIRDPYGVHVRFRCKLRGACYRPKKGSSAEGLVPSAALDERDDPRKFEFFQTQLRSDCSRVGTPALCAFHLLKGDRQELAVQTHVRFQDREKFETRQLESSPIWTSALKS